MITPKRFNKIPTLDMSDTRKRSVPKTIALGGVATGNIKAKEQESVPGIIKKRGLIRRETANAARIGNSISAVAVLEVNSVKKVISK